MTRMTKSIALVLVSSSLLLGSWLAYDAWNGETSGGDFDDPDQPTTPTVQQDGSHRHVASGGGTHFWYHRVGPTWNARPAPARPGGNATASAVRSGGFGGTGRAMAVGS